jgi:cytoskeletal protein CcmA (bactofilin family)
MTWMRQKPDSEPSSAPAPNASSNQPARRSTPPPPTREAQPSTGKTVNIGPSVNIKGTLSGREDLTVDGKVEGKITLKEHVLTIGSNGQIQADLQAKAVIVHGKVTGNITADNKVEITSSGTVHGDIRAPRVAIADTAISARRAWRSPTGRCSEAPSTWTSDPPPNRRGAGTSPSRRPGKCRRAPRSPARREIHAEKSTPAG